jgi:glutathione S-transferase
MQLLYNTASPYARKCRILICELGLDDKVAQQDVGMLSPLHTEASLFAVNPLGKIPVLLLRQEQALQDSRVICEYLNHFAAGPFFPDGNARFLSLQCQALADGLLDAALTIRYQLGFCENPWMQLIEKQRVRKQQALQALEDTFDEWKEDFTVGEVAIACALGYLDFRFAEWNWRQRYPRVADWFTGMSARQSLADTVPG